MNRTGTFAVWMLLSSCSVPVLLQAQTASIKNDDRPHLSLVVERSEGGKWIPLNPQTVLDNGNAIRFQLLTSFSGYLYAYYKAANGEAQWLYPTPGKETNNRIEAGGSYIIPSTSASYIVSGKPGFDVVYWVVSPKSLAGTNWKPTSSSGPVPRTIIPMCRPDLPGSGCLDDRAGAVTVSNASEIMPPAAPSTPVTIKARELRLATAGDTTRIEALDGPGLFVYEFLVAHR